MGSCAQMKRRCVSRVCGRLVAPRGALSSSRSTHLPLLGRLVHAGRELGVLHGAAVPARDAVLAGCSAATRALRTQGKSEDEEGQEEGDGGCGERRAG